jgi:hypothetical protein
MKLTQKWDLDGFQAGDKSSCKSSYEKLIMHNDFFDLLKRLTLNQKK